MSLDVHLESNGTCQHCGKDSGVRGGEIFWKNITHNLSQMADQAGIYQHLWEPQELDITKANQLIEPLKEGLVRLRAEPDRFKKFNPKNGWGCYEGLIAFVEDYLKACIENPGAIVRVIR